MHPSCTIRLISAEPTVDQRHTRICQKRNGKLIEQSKAFRRSLGCVARCPLCTIYHPPLRTLATYAGRSCIRPSNLERNMAESASEEHLEKIISSAKDWRSSEDPDDPHNWPTWRKIHTTGTAAGLSLVATFASSPISSGLDEIAAELHTSSELARFAFAIYILGLGLGSVLTAPCSETFGRRAVYWFFFPIFALFVLGTGFSHSVGALIVTRFFAGVFASPGLAIGSGVLSDVWYSEQRAVPMVCKYTSTTEDCD